MVSKEGHQLGWPKLNEENTAPSHTGAAHDPDHRIAIGALI